MRTHRILVLGAGPAGLAASLRLADQGHAVTLLERDAIGPCSPEDAITAPRGGIAHYLQPHAFIPRGCRELQAHFPGVHAALLEAGASIVDVSRKLPGGAGPEDTELLYLAVRRPVIEWAMRHAAIAHPGIRVRSGVAIEGIDVAGDGYVAARAAGESHAADVVVDAMGRRSPLRGWLAAAGLPSPGIEKSDCGVIYYSRYYRVRPGQVLPDGPWTLGPRGDLGYMGYSTFPGDNGTFAAVFAVPTGVTELKVLQHEAAFEAAIAQIPALAVWANADLAEPVTAVLAMGGLQNTWSPPAEHLARNVFPVADAIGHTDPVLAHGLSFALIHARALGEALRAHDDVADARRAYLAAITPLLRERYEYATALDAQRLRMWRGEAVDFAHRDGDYALFTLVAGNAVARVDADVFRTIIRRFGLLDSTQVLDDDPVLQARIESRFAELRATTRPVPGTPRGEMLAAMNAAAGG